MKLQNSFTDEDGYIKFDITLIFRTTFLNYALNAAKPSQAKPKFWLGAETCAKRKSTSPCLLAIPAFDRIAGLYNRHLNSNRGIC
jgi:hypothetical protein